MLRPTTLSRATQPLQQFRPVLLPNNPQPISSIQNQFRPKSTINKHRLPKKKFVALKEQLAAEAAASSTTSQPPPTTAAAQPEPAEPKPRGPSPFVISRTASRNLPVYLEAKRGGNKKLTLIRKLEGDRTVLAQWLAEDFGLDRKKVRVKAPTNHVELEGEYVNQVKEWLEARGF